MQAFHDGRRKRNTPSRKPVISGQEISGALMQALLIILQSTEVDLQAEITDEVIGGARQASRRPSFCTTAAVMCTVSYGSGVTVSQ